jgi:hypothetical protein
MNSAQVDQENQIKQRIAEEEKIQQRVDENGTRWTKVYFGGGAHFRNWLSQFIELKGEENVKVEEADSTGFQCYEESGEKMYRIWVKDTDLEGHESKANDELNDAPFYDSMEAYQNRM